MSDILKEINKVRTKIKKGPADTLFLQKPFLSGMYRFSMFMIDYYARVRKNLKLDYDSFMIIQTVVSHSLYSLNKKNGISSYKELETEWEKIISDKEKILDLFDIYKPQKTSQKLTLSSICLVSSLPKETVRRKVNQLVKKNLLKNSKKEGILLGSQYKRIFQDFVPITTLEVSKLIKFWHKSGILKNLLEFNT